MPTLRLHDDDEPRPALRFPAEQARNHSGESNTIDRSLEALDSVDRRIDRLARELNCLGHFDDGEDDRPRAA